MVKGLDFNTVKKQCFPVTLPDEKKTKLLITTPKKGTLDNFMSVKDALTSENVSEEALTEIYDIVASIMSENKAGKKITGKQLAVMFDFEDLIIFIKGYTEFIQEITGSKN